MKMNGISCGRDAHRGHDAEGKCILYFKNAGPPMQNLEAFRGTAELNLKVSLRMGSESEIEVSNSCDLAWIGQKSQHFRWEV